MAYNHSISMANIHNVVAALNFGGMLTCNDIMERLWDGATDEQKQHKINAPRNIALRNEEFARKQIRQEVRRSLNQYETLARGQAEPIYHISSATALGDAERFWVNEPQVIVSVENTLRELMEEL